MPVAGQSQDTDPDQNKYELTHENSPVLMQREYESVFAKPWPRENGKFEFTVVLGEIWARWGPIGDGVS